MIPENSEKYEFSQVKERESAMGSEWLSQGTNGITMTYNATFVKNPDYRPCFIYSYLLVHCISGFYFGYQMTILNNLGKPILHDVFGLENIKDSLANMTLGFGLGKMVGSIVAGGIQKKLGKLKVLYIGEIFNLFSAVCVGICITYQSVWLLLISRVLVGVMCGFNTSTAPRLILECFPTKMRGIGGIFSNSVAFGVMLSFCLGYLLEDYLSNFWYVFLLAPSVISLLRMAILVTAFRFETPIYYQSQIEKIRGTVDSKAKIQDYKNKSEKIYRTFNKNLNDA